MGLQAVVLKRIKVAHNLNEPSTANYSGPCSVTSVFLQCKQANFS